LSQPIANIESVSKTYHGKLALDEVSLQIPPGVTGLLGPNGSGKTTFIKALLGLIRIDSGRGEVLGYSWPKETRAIRDQVGYLPEDDCYIHGLQGVQSVQMMARLSGFQRLEALRRAHEVCDFCDLAQERYRTVEGYSTGMRQKLKFAQALVHDPEMIILDEPTTGLDPSQRENFLDRINVLAKEKGKTILLSTHILHDVSRVCDNVIILVGGQVKLTDSLENLQRPTQASLHVCVVSDPHDLNRALSARGLNATVSGPQDLTVFGSDIDVDSIWQASRDAKVLIQRIEPAKNSLEEMFLDAVKG
jgi:ABC-2 type transport system ATP-binding protein